MTEFEWVTVALSALAVLALPALALVIRLTVRFTSMADKLTSLVEDKERVHAEMYRTMREDRAATDRRLRWLEENLWRYRRRPRDQQG